MTVERISNALARSEPSRPCVLEELGGRGFRAWPCHEAQVLAPIGNRAKNMRSVAAQGRPKAHTGLPFGKPTDTVPALAAVFGTGAVEER